MEERIITFSANQQSLIKTGGISHYASDTVSYIKAIFELGENWTGFDEVRAVFKTPYDTRVAVLNSLGECEVPHEILMLKAEVRVSLVGSIYTEEAVIDRLTTYSCEALEVDEDVPVEGGGTITPTPSEYEQFVAKVKEDAERAEAGATASEQSATESANSASASAESAQEAEAHASSAQIYAGMASNEAEASANSASEAQTYAQNASESATDAEGYAEDAEDARDTILGMRATANTLSEGSDATASYSNGLLTLGIPRGNTGAKGDKGDRGDVGATPNLSIGTVTTLEPTEDATATISGTAENPILSFGIPKGDTGEVSLSELEDATVVQTLSDTEPYNYRRTNNGNGSGTREYDEIVGCSVAWNQLAKSLNSGNWRAESGATLTFNDGEATLVSTKVSFGMVSTIGSNIKISPSHVYLFSFDAKAESELSIRGLLGASNGIYRTRTIGTSYGRINMLMRATANVNDGYIYIYPNEASGLNKQINIKNVQLTDITLFNSQIAEYVYSLEQSTVNSGATWLMQHFPKQFDNGFQPFDAGSIKSVSGLTAHEMVGVNQWDEEWEVGILDNNGEEQPRTTAIRAKNFMRITPNKNYYVFSGSNKYVYGFFYDADKATVGAVNVRNGEFTAPSNAYYYRFSMGTEYGTTYNHDICINLSETSINGQYFPYEKHTYPLDSSVTLRGKYVLDNGQLKAVGDVYPSSGEVTHVWGEVTFDGSSDEAWNTEPFPKTTDDNNFYIEISNGKRNSTARTQWFEGYAISLNNTEVGQPNTFVSVTGKLNVYFAKGLTTIEALRTYLASHPMTVLYELATPTTETATAYDNPQWCDSHGTEEYVGSELPVGHNTQYPMSLVDTMPTANGTFEPRVTVTNGVRTVTWVSV